MPFFKTNKKLKEQINQLKQQNDDLTAEKEKLQNKLSQLNADYKKARDKQRNLEKENQELLDRETDARIKALKINRKAMSVGCYESWKKKRAELENRLLKIGSYPLGMIVSSVCELALIDNVTPYKECKYLILYYHKYHWKRAKWILQTAIIDPKIASTKKDDDWKNEDYNILKI